MRSRSWTIVASLATGISAAVIPGIADQVSHDTQQPFVPAVQDTINYDVRRYELGASNDLENVLRLAKAHNLDVWSSSRNAIDIHFEDDTPIPDHFHSLNYTSLTASYTPPSDDFEASGRHKGPYDDIGSWNASSLANCTFHKTYHTFDEIHAFVQQLAEEFPKYVELVKLGRTQEGRDIIGLSISRKGRRGSSKRRKRRMVIQGAQHAREWIATSTALYVAHSLLVDKHDANSHRKLLKHMDFTIIPVPNPDGYAYTWSHDRLWYKNRQNIHGGKCKGLDLNRNWDYEWQASDDTDPCSHWYPGAKPFDALETRAVSAYIKRTPNIHAFLDLRSYGQLIMHPYSYSCSHHAADEENLMEAALGAAQAMSKRHGTKIDTGSVCNKLYSAGGNIVDWMYGHAKITVTYSVMLRDQGTYGFILPASMIRPAGEETADMVAYLSRWIKKRKP